MDSMGQGAMQGMISEAAQDSKTKTHLLQLIDTKAARVAIIGLGYVGLPLGLSFAEAGFQVIGLDIDPEKVDHLNAGQSYIEHIPTSRVAEAVARGFRATADFAEAHKADALIMCVPTPLTRHREPDLTFVLGTMETLAPHLRAGQIVCLESTTYPGTTDEELLPRIEHRGLKVGRDVFLAFSPEREDPGNLHYALRAIPKVCGGATPACLDVARALYAGVIDRIVPVSSTKAAELTKLLENIHRAVNIGLVNEMKIIADRMGIDIHEVIRAAATKPFGFVPYFPGPGLGGHCIPIDPFYLTWKAREYGLHTRFIELAGEINSTMPEWVVGKVTDALNARQKSINGARILILGVAYKKNVGDMRESPALELIHLLQAKGAHIDYSDPHVPVLPRTRRAAFDLRSVTLTPQAVASYDLVLLVTDHTKFDYAMVSMPGSSSTRAVSISSASTMS
jgi:UDP-N-acetyl-D-glucosamine dehydrogenase